MVQFNPRWLLAPLLTIIVPIAAIACSVPVFRYALEHWRPDAYRVYVYHDRDLDDSDRQRMQGIRDRSIAGANVQAVTIDVREPLDPSDQRRWDRLTDRSLPRMVVELPVAAGMGGDSQGVGSAEWTGEEVDRLLASPARVELGKRLVAGDVVWLFLDSGDRELDDRLFERLARQIDVEQSSLELPAIEEHDLKDLSTDPAELEIRFSAMRLSRTDEAEKWLIEMLLSVEPDLRDEDFEGQPMVFPIFGRGRALFALVGEGISADLIHEAAAFLTGACQCTVKAENPGVDLLISVPWDNLIQVSDPEAVSPPLIGLGGRLPLIDLDDSPPNQSTTLMRDEFASTVAGEETASVPLSVTKDVTADAERSVGRETHDAVDVVAAIDPMPGLLWPAIGVIVAVGVVAGLVGLSILRRA